MFELSIACKYLLPRWRQLSVCIISLVSTLVIALVVWLIVVFFSVKDGLENSWVQKIVALTAPMRLNPTDKYYNSYYHLIDTISNASDYTAKDIGEKLNAAMSDPYDSSTDEEIPRYWTKPDRDATGALKDPVKQAAEIALAIPYLKNARVSDYLTTMANMRLRFVRNITKPLQQSQQFLDQPIYVGSFDSDSPALAKALQPISSADLTNLLHMQGIANSNNQEDSPESIHQLPQDLLNHHLDTFFKEIEVTALETPKQGWPWPSSLWPEEAQFHVVAIMYKDNIVKIMVPAKASDVSPLVQKLSDEGLIAVAANLHLDHEALTLTIANQERFIPPHTPLVIPSRVSLPATVNLSSLKTATRPGNVHFHLNALIQGYPLAGEIPLGHFEIKGSPIAHEPQSYFAITDSNTTKLQLPSDTQLGDPVLLPRAFRDAGALIGDQGYVSYYTPTPSTVQEQRIPIVVAGFYDPGIMPLGNKYLLAPKALAAQIHSSYGSSNHTSYTNGLNIRFDNLDKVRQAKAELIHSLELAGIASYWNVETYEEYEFVKDLIQQLHSEKNLFSLISLIIIVVACSNIISMLIILVNDKKMEIGILRSMGATSASIATIFGLCGMVMGTVGSLIGIGASLLTLRYLNELVKMISEIQGYDLFNPVFYGNILPSELSVEALSFVIITTAGISLLAGIVPAIKASLLRPSLILRAE